MSSEPHVDLLCGRQGPSFQAIFPWSFTGSLLGCEASGTWTGAHMGCRHCRLRTNPACLNADRQVTLTVMKIVKENQGMLKNISHKNFRPAPIRKESLGEQGAISKAQLYKRLGPVPGMHEDDFAWHWGWRESGLLRFRGLSPSSIHVLPRWPELVHVTSLILNAWWRLQPISHPSCPSTVRHIWGEGMKSLRSQCVAWGLQSLNGWVQTLDTSVNDLVQVFSLCVSQCLYSYNEGNTEHFHKMI